jgi:hypothetical protein
MTRESRRSRQRRWRVTSKGRAVTERYEASHIRIRVAGVSAQYRVAPERKSDLQAQLAEFRANQRKERLDGGIDQAIA